MRLGRLVARRLRAALLSLGAVLRLGASLLCLLNQQLLLEELLL